MSVVPDRTPNPTPYDNVTDSPRVRAGRSDLMVYPLNLGANPFGWTADEPTSFSILDDYREGGGNFIDTADVYSRWAEDNQGGESETIIGRWLQSRGSRDDMVLATKVGQLPPHDNVSAGAIAGACEDSLRRLGADTIDLYYLHFDDESTPIAEQVEAMEKLIDAGKIRYVGLSNYSPTRMREYLETARGTAAAPVAIQPHYNLVHRSEYEQDYRPLASEFRLAVFPYFALASGILTGKYRSQEDLRGTAREEMAGKSFSQEALRVVGVLERIASAHDVSPATVALIWLRAKGVTAPIASVSKPEQLPALMASARLRLTESEVMALDAASQSFA